MCSVVAAGTILASNEHKALSVLLDVAVTVRVVFEYGAYYKESLSALSYKILIDRHCFPLWLSWSASAQVPHVKDTQSIQFHIGRSHYTSLFVRVTCTSPSGTEVNILGVVLDVTTTPNNCPDSSGMLLQFLDGYNR